MPKLKTHSGAAKRFKKTGTGKFKRGQSKMRHILTSKATKTKKQARSDRPRLRGGHREGRTDASLRVKRSPNRSIESFQSSRPERTKGQSKRIEAPGAAKALHRDLEVASE